MSNPKSKCHNVEAVPMIEDSVYYLCPECKQRCETTQAESPSIPISKVSNCHGARISFPNTMRLCSQCNQPCTLIDKPQEEEVLYRKVSVKERLPKEFDKDYFVLIYESEPKLLRYVKGEWNWYDEDKNDYQDAYIDFWLEAVTIEEILSQYKK